MYAAASSIDVAGISPQTVIAQYLARSPAHVELVLPMQEWAVDTAIGDFRLGAPLATEIRPEAPRVTSFFEVSQADELIGKLYSYLSLTDGWDGEAGVTPQLQAVLDAEQFVRLLPEEIALPKPMIASDGEIGLYWSFSAGHAEVTFNGAGEFTYFVQRGHRAVLAENVALPKAQNIDEMFALAA